MPNSDENKVILKQRERLFVEGVVAGKSARRSALDAGYSEFMAESATAKILPKVRATLAEELEKRMPMGKLAEKILAGLEATEVRLASKGGEFTDERSVPDFSERRETATLLAKLLGALNESPQTNVQVVLDL